MNDLITATLVERLPADHQAMADEIVAWKPHIDLANRNFGKRQTQFMDRLLTVSHPTPLRNLRQCLAEIEQAMQALRENHYRRERAKIEARRAKHLAEKVRATDHFAAELLDLEAREKEEGVASGQLYIDGCVRRIAGHLATYRAILASIGASSFDEVDVEREEERYHIAKAFEQALCAARSKNTCIDEGNHGYLYQIGVNGGMAQQDVHDYLVDEAARIKSGEHLGPEHCWAFIQKMVAKYEGSAQRVLDLRGAGPALTEHTAVRHLAYEAAAS